MKRARPSSAGGAFASDFAEEPTFAEGTSVERNASLPVGAAWFSVTVHYREPEFERRSGRRAHPFRWTYRIAAADADAAATVALREFNETAKDSSVAWRRDIVGIVSEPIDAEVHFA